ncbi:hypothetical protein ACFC1I_17235 [Microbacterium sp. NPDC056044]|uniref:hypothetical protein n=1 Tax=Microbacterium sp. NPDC056044 TaxID=3345690 RepID=UPI0035E371C8
MAAIDGSWALEVATLAGSMHFDATLTTVGTSLTGTAIGPTGPIAIRGGTASGDTAEFTLDLVGPLPMSLVVKLHVIGDRLTGTAQAGPYPPSNIVGTRTG